jgi:HD-GYP domain-containing protein (c-di-GMP phosphodiesterase class II)
VTRGLRVLLVVVPVAAIVTFAASWIAFPIQDAVHGFPGLLFWVLMALGAAASPIQVPRGPFVSVAMAPIVAAGIVGGPTAAGVVAVIGTLELREFRGGVPLYGLVYNHTSLVIPAVLAGVASAAISSHGGIASLDGLAGAVVAGLVYLLGNETMTAAAICLREGRSFRAVLEADLRSYGLSLIGLTPLAWLMALAYTVVGPLVALVFALPLYTTRAAYKAVVDIRTMFTQTVRALASAIDARDPSTKLHSEHVSAIAVEIGQAMGLSESDLEQLEWAGLLHDIGKIGIRDSVLLKPERLTREERLAMNEHPAKGEEILKGVDRLSRERPLIRHHHEWYNGSGYPDRLIGEEIPLLARVLHVADAFEAMTAARPYRPVPLTNAEALAELHRYAGIQFDPNVVEAFTRTTTARRDRGARDRQAPEPTVIPTLGQVAAKRAASAMTAAPEPN